MAASQTDSWALGIDFLRRQPIIYPLLLLLTALGGCQQTQLEANNVTTISVAGATSMGPLLVDLTSEFSRQYPNVRFDIIGGDSAIGEERVQLAQVELAASTLISPAHTTVLGIGLPDQPIVRTPIGLDGLAIIVNKSNPIENLTLIQLQELYSGRIWNWQELGGPEGDVLLVTREDGSGSRALFDERIMGSTPVALTAVVMPTSEEVVNYVAAYTGTIGYVSRAYVVDLLEADPRNADLQHDKAMASAQPTARLQNADILAQIHIVRVEGQLPTLETLQTQSYFLIEPLYLVTLGPPDNMLKRFIDFTLSPAGQAIVRRYHQPIR